MFINGTWREATAGARDDIIDPFDQKVLVAVPSGTAADTEAAILAARTAFDDGPWPRTPVAERAAVLVRVADLLTRDKADIARTETLDTGKTLVESLIDVDDVISVFRYYADLASDLHAGPVDTGSARRSQPDRPRAGRRLRADHAVELPAAPASPGRSRPRWPPATPSCSSPARSRR